MVQQPIQTPIKQAIRTPIEPPMQQPLPEEGTAQKKKTLLELAIAVVSGSVLLVLALSGVISVGVAVVIFALLLVGMLILHGSGAEIASGISDQEGYERQLEEEEQRKAQEEEESGDSPGEDDH